MKKRGGQRAVSLLLATALTVGMSTGGACAIAAPGTTAAVEVQSLSTFTDLEGHWAKDAILRWNGYDVVNGVGAGRFAPDEALTRVQFFAMLGRVLGGTQRADLSQFPDVDPNAWYAEDLARAVALGLTIGDENKNIHPNDYITRESMAVVMARAFQLSGGNGMGQFTDAGQVSSWAADAVSAVASAGVMKGKDGGRFAPADNATRAEAVAVLDQALAALIQADASGDVTGNALINTNGVTLSGGTVSGRLYLSQGAQQNVALEKVNVQQQTIVMGGGFQADGSSFGELRITADNAVVTLSKDCAVDKVVITGKNVSLLGECVADQVEIHAEGAKLATKPGKIVLDDGLSATVAGKAYPTTSSGSSSSSGGSDDEDGGSDTPSETLSPDAAKIRTSMTNVDTAKGFSLVNVPSECTTNHKNGEEVGSHPFSSMYCSVGEIDKLVEQMGYGEAEYFMSGTANVYGLAETGVNVPVIKTSGADYTTRLLIHYPKDAEKFSGNIYVDILNASAGYDLEDIYRRSYQHFMENGDIYIGITSKTTTAQALKNFDAERYADIDWLVDNDDPASAENGLFWDMLSQLGTVLKERPEDLLGADLGAKAKANGRTYLVGQSQSGFYLQTYLSVFYPYINNILDGKDIFDGYFNAVGATPTTLSTGVSITNTGWPDTEEPYLVVMGEGEAKMRLSMGYYATKADSDTSTSKFRLYEVAGAPHADPTSEILPNNFEIAKAKADGTSRDIKKYEGDHVEGDLHLNEFITGALVNLDEWARNGVAAPAGQLLQADETGKAIARDAYGNALGGLRSPKIDAPLATYYGCINDSSYSTEGSMIHFTQAQLDERYEGSSQAEKYADYLAEFKASADKALAERYITQSDYDKLIAWSKETSAFGQKDGEILAGQTTVPTVELQDASGEEIFNSTAMSVGQKDESWDEKAPVWVPALQLNDDGTIQYVNKSGAEPTYSEKYTEKEYFVSGTANLYDIAPDNRLMVREDGLPYTNRILVRAPADPEKFNGKVYVDILNASDKYDNESLWRRAYGMIMEEGAAYVGITSKPVCVAALQRFSDRYDELSWASPNTWLFSSYKIDKANGQTAEQAYENFWVTAGELPYTDIGLVWDILSQTGYAIQANTADMFGAGKSVEGVYLYGQSQSGFVMNEYFRFMDFLKDNGKALPFDGFMNVVGTYPANKINQSDTTAIAANTEDGYYIGKNLGVPVMYVTSQMDYNASFRPEGSNVDEDSLFALYEIAGAPHSDPAAPVFPYNDILTAMGYPARNLFPTFDQGQVVSDYNSNMFVQALLLQLDAWAQEGTAPTALENPYLTKEEDGTVSGGLRSPQLDAPVAHYYEKPLGSAFSTTGTMVPYTAEELKAAYTDKADYIAKFNAALEKLVEAGLIRATDKGYMEQYRDAKAAELESILTPAP